MKLATADQMREIDRIAIHERGIAGIELMRRAGRAVAQAACEIYEPDSVAILTGKGNNAGDGFVTACELHNRGVAVTVFLLDPPDHLSGDAALAYAEFNKLLWTQAGESDIQRTEIRPQEFVIEDAAQLEP